MNIRYVLVEEISLKTTISLIWDIAICSLHIFDENAFHTNNWLLYTTLHNKLRLLHLCFENLYSPESTGSKSNKKYLTNNTEKKQSVHSNCKVPM